MQGLFLAMFNGVVTGASVSFGAWLVGRHIIKRLEKDKCGEKSIKKAP